MKSNVLYLVCAAIVIVALSGCDSKNKAETKETLAKNTDTTTKASSKAPCICAGKLQSPINIVEDSTVMAALPEIKYIGAPISMYIENNRETLKITPTDTIHSTNYIIFNGKRYDFKNIHFHHKSEHWINNRPDSMEMHIVFQNSQSKAYVVTGLLMSMGTNSSLVLSSIWNGFPPLGNYNKIPLRYPVNITDIIGYKQTDVYYTYVGSLTTPDYNEGVAWLVFKKRLVLTGAMIEKFKSYYENDARPIFPINNRLIYRSK